MNINTKDKFKKIPIAYAGLALGIAGITTAWGILNVQYKPITYLGALIAMVLLFFLLLKIAFQFEIFKTEVRQSMLGSMFQTFFMALSVISAAFVSFNYLVFKTLWIFSAIGMALYLLYFIYLRFKQKDFHTLLPSWFVPTIGIAIVAVTSSAMKSYSISSIYFYIAFVILLVLYPIMIYKFFFVEKIEEKITPVFAIFGAPPNITLAGYLTAFETPNKIIVYLLVGLGLFSTFLVYTTLYRVKRIGLNFSPLYAAFTFPLAIGTTSMIKFYYYLLHLGGYDEYLYIWKCIINTEIVIASVVIFYVLVNMIIFSCKNIFKS